MGGGPAAGMPSGGGDVELGSLLGEAFDSATGEAPPETPSGEGGTAEPEQPFESPVETPAGEAPTSQAAPAPESPWKLAPDGNSYLMPKGEMPRIQSALKFSEAVGQIFATPTEAQSAALQATDLRTMSNDWMYGSDEAIRSVLGHWAGSNHQDPQSRAAFQRSFAKMVQMAPDTLRQVNPQAYTQFLSSTTDQAIAAAYEKAAQTGNQDDFLAAQSMDWGKTGKYKTELPKVDPAAQAQQAWQREKQEFTQRQEQALKRDVGTFNQTAVEGAKFNQLSSRIDAVLAPVKAKYGEVAYGDLKAGIQREVVDSLMKSEWFTEHRQNFDQLISDYQHTWRSGSPGQGLQPRVQAYINDFLVRASRVLPQIAQKRINATTQARVGRQAPGPRPGTARPSPQASNGNQATERMSSDQWDKEFAEALRV